MKQHTRIHIQVKVCTSSIMQSTTDRIAPSDDIVTHQPEAIRSNVHINIPYTTTMHSCEKTNPVRQLGQHTNSIEKNIKAHLLTVS